MKRNGFTLAEVLITLGIIGVVAALTAPSLVSEFNSAKIGPSLRKFMNTMETAHQQILAEKEANRLSSAVNLDEKEYFDSLSQYIQGSSLMETAKDLSMKPSSYDGKTVISMTNDGPIFHLQSGEDFAISMYDKNTLNSYRNGTNGFRTNGSYKGTFAAIYYDINGFGVKPNRLGKDIFRFNVDDNGSLIPNGGKLQVQAYGKKGDVPAWSQSWGRCDEDGVNGGHACSASIMDNNWKVIYE